MIKFPNKKYQIIYADPPWLETGGGKITRGAQKHYNLMKTSDIINLPISNISDSNCHLYLWVTNTFLSDGLKVMKNWGFNYKTTITWVKDRIGLGQYFRGQTEHCLFGVKGMIPYRIINNKRQQGVTYFFAPRTKHSAKPQQMRNMILKVSGDLPRIELFARKKETDLFGENDLNGWDTWGNEA